MTNFDHTSNPADFMFGDPTASTAARWNAKDRIDHLNAFQGPFQVERAVPTAYGEADAIRIYRIVDIDTGEEFFDVLCFNKRIINQLASKDGYVLGRIATMPPKPGQSPAFVIDHATEADAEKARAVLAQLEQTKPEPRPAASGGASHIEDPFVSSADTADIEAVACTRSPL